MSFENIRNSLLEEIHGTQMRDTLEWNVETSFAGLADYRASWDETVVRLAGSIYMTYDWIRIWWEHYGSGKQLRVFLFRCEGRLVGILPLYIETLGWGPLSLRVARLVGANIPPKVFTPPIDEAFAEEMFNVVLSQLLQEDNCEIVSWGPVSDLDKPALKFAQACHGSRNVVAECHAEPYDVHTVFWLPATMESYFAGLAGSERKKRKYELRLLQKEHKINVDVVKDPGPAEQEFQDFVVQHGAQWAAEGKAGHFRAWPKGLDFNSALVRANAPLGRVRFVRIIADGQVVSTQYIFSFGESWYWELPARAVGSEWDRLSLGPAGLINTIESAIQEGKRRIEGGIGHYDYKVRLGAKEHGLLRFRAVANRPFARFRVRFFSLLKLALLYGYHKVWYRRVAPHLRKGAGRQQWSVWLRYDF